MTTDRGHFEIIEGLPNDVVAVRAVGVIDREDYEKVLVPLVESRIREEGRIKFLYVLGDEFEGITAGAAWEDMELGLLHLGDFARMAVVTDVEWIRLAVKLFAPLVRGEVRLFRTSELEAAKAWISENVPEAGTGGPAVAARKLPPLEDKVPPAEGMVPPKIG
ncbi:MAG: STAS/SEC14 domain-containing protein [Alphaproteobacteria bacterium]|nr:MAG: STAS/SEC14 domain-containing protein [Alphaproteobacteria bacterium]